MKCDACDYFASPDHCCVESRSVKPCPEIRTCDKFKYEAGVGEIVWLERERERARCAKICDTLTQEYRQLLRAANECNHRDRVAAYVARIEALAEALEMIRGEG